MFGERTGYESVYLIGRLAGPDAEFGMPPSVIGAPMNVTPSPRFDVATLDSRQLPFALWNPKAACPKYVSYCITLEHFSLGSFH